jgi:hypothetical protein
MQAERCEKITSSFPAQSSRSPAALDCLFYFQQYSILSQATIFQNCHNNTMLRGTITLDISKATEKTPAKSELLDIGGYKW